MANVTHPAMYFNVDLLCVSDFDAYDESLNFIGAVLQFMQKHPSLNVVPDEANKINEQNTLRLDLESESYFDTHNLWSSLGAKYQPSIIIKASQITIDSDSVMRRIPVVESVGVNVDE